MKKTLSILLVLFSFLAAKAQNNSITGSVQDETGRLLHFVFVDDGKYKDATFTDSVGTFTIPVHADSRLLFQLDGYRDTLIDADKISPSTQIMLKSSVNLGIETTPLSLQTAITSGGGVAVARLRPNLVGSRYMFDTFARGYLTDMSGKQIFDEYCLFNYEKISGFILLTADRQHVMEVDKGQVKSFTLYNRADQRFDFELVPAIDKSHYVQILASGAKYKICRLTKTQFIPGEVAHTAAGDVGSGVDQYVDDVEYYLLDVKSNRSQTFSLRKRSIREAFSKETDKAHKFLSDNRGDIDDAYLGKLGAYMNQ
jgi:hypothetical protein